MKNENSLSTSPGGQFFEAGVGKLFPGILVRRFQEITSCNFLPLTRTFYYLGGKLFCISLVNLHCDMC